MQYAGWHPHCGARRARLAYTPIWLFADALLDGRVLPLLEQHIGPAAPIHAVYPQRRLLPTRAKVFMEFIAEEFAREPALNAGASAAIAGARRGALR